MWAASVLVFLANPLVGAVLLISAAITTNIKAVKVDSEWAKKGELPPTARLVEKWLDSRKARGLAPQSAKVRPYGSWAYAWQRWYAMWEDLGDKHREERAAYKAAVAEAKRTGRPVPARPGKKERESGWKWSIPNLIAPVGEKPKDEPVPTVEAAPATTGDGPLITCDDCGSRYTTGPDGGHVHPAHPACPKAKPAPQKTTSAGDASARIVAGPATTGMLWPDGTCPTCSRTAPILASGLCERCTARLPHGFCPHCKGVLIHWEGEWVHGPASPCQYRESAAGHTASCAGGCGKTFPQHPSQLLKATCRDCHAAATDQGPASSEPPSGSAPNIEFAEPGNPPAGQPVPEGDPMTATSNNTQQSGEVVGLQSAINYADAVAAAHAGHSTGGGETYRASLGHAKVGEETVQSAARAQELSEMAAAAWAEHASKLREQLAAKEHTTSETGTKEFLLAD